MKETGIVRKIDRMGRVVLPKELRWKYNVDSGDFVEIYTDGEGIYLRKYRRESDFMNQVGDLYRTVESMEKELQDTKELQGDLINIRHKLEKLQKDDK
ncbi:MAG: AbrB/MazE/SpoVT family DNA-binding domain-containing protein [Lachnospiraceae bacterium]